MQNEEASQLFQFRMSQHVSIEGAVKVSVITFCQGFPRKKATLMNKGVALYRPPAAANVLCKKGGHRATMHAQAYCSFQISRLI